MLVNLRYELQTSLEVNRFLMFFMQAECEEVTENGRMGFSFQDVRGVGRRQQFSHTKMNLKIQ